VEQLVAQVGQLRRALGHPYNGMADGGRADHAATTSRCRTHVL
jgi:hypothetical protein